LHCTNISSVKKV